MLGVNPAPPAGRGPGLIRPAGVACRAGAGVKRLNPVRRVFLIRWMESFHGAFFIRAALVDIPADDFTLCRLTGDPRGCLLVTRCSGGTVTRKTHLELRGMHVRKEMNGRHTSKERQAPRIVRPSSTTVRDR